MGAANAVGAAAIGHLAAAVLIARLRDAPAVLGPGTGPVDAVGRAAARDLRSRQRGWRGHQRPWAHRLGKVRALLTLFWGSQPFLFLIPLTGSGSSIALYPLGAVAATYGLAAYNVLQTTFRQLVCPPHLYGRMTASSKFLVWGGIPVGAALGGILGELAGVRPALWVAATGALLSGIWLIASPLRRASLGRQADGHRWWCALAGPDRS